MNLYQHAKNQFITFVHSSDTVNFRVLSHDWSHPLLSRPIPTIFNHFLICMNLYQHAKNHLILLVHSWDTVNFRVQRPDWPYPFLTITNQKIFNQLLIIMNFYQHAKNEAVSLICSGEIVDLKNPAIWWAENILAYISGSRFFPNLGFVKDHRKWKFFSHRTNSVKINDQIFL